jgi:hypothetical protein
MNETYTETFPWKPQGFSLKTLHAREVEGASWWETRISEKYSQEKCVHFHWFLCRTILPMYSTSKKYFQAAILIWYKKSIGTLLAYIVSDGAQGHP